MKSTLYILNNIRKLDKLYLSFSKKYIFPIKQQLEFYRFIQGLDRNTKTKKSNIDFKRECIKNYLFGFNFQSTKLKSYIRDLKKAKMAKDVINALLNEAKVARLWEILLRLVEYLNPQQKLDLIDELGNDEFNSHRKGIMNHLKKQLENFSSVDGSVAKCQINL